MYMSATLENLTSLAKRRGFIYQGSEIYGGLAGTWDYGPLGVQLKRNLQNLWWKKFVEDRSDMYGLDSAILMNPKVWQASGHTGAGFADPLVEDLVTKKRYRADHLLEENGIEDAEAMSFDEMNQVIIDKSIKSPDKNPLSEVRKFNMMFETSVGPIKSDDSMAYLRPETAQGMFVNFKNVVDSFYPDMPFGIAQIGKAFRNEISPREFIFRVREFEIAELEYFIEEKNWETEFENWMKRFYDWCESIGLQKSKIHELEVSEADRAHYSKRTVDFEYEFEFGTKEIGAVAYRTDFDLSNHAKESGAKLEYRPKGGGEAYTPHVIEPTFGVDRSLLAVLSAAYKEGDDRAWLALPEVLAPVKMAVTPLARNKPELVAKAREVYEKLQAKHGNVEWSAGGNIGKFYARNDEIGTPKCVTVDFDTLENDTVTVRDRDTAEQTVIPISELTN
jgi:glycyl-tRNA synthetase